MSSLVLDSGRALCGRCDIRLEPERRISSAAVALKLEASSDWASVKLFADAAAAAQRLHECHCHGSPCRVPAARLPARFACERRCRSMTAGACTLKAAAKTDEAL